jgi:hypothetical protein
MTDDAMRIADDAEPTLAALLASAISGSAPIRPSDELQAGHMNGSLSGSRRVYPAFTSSRPKYQPSHLS